MNEAKRIFLTPNDLIVLNGYKNYKTALDRLHTLNNHLILIGQKVLNIVHITVKNYAMLYEIDEKQVLQALQNKHKLFLTQKDVAIIENKTITNDKPYKKAKRMVGKTIMNQLCIYDYCDLYDIPLDVVLDTLNTNSKKQTKNTSI